MNLKKYFLFTICLLYLFQFQAYACIPFTSNQIIVWNYNWKIENTVPERSWNFQFIDFINFYKPFPWNNTEIWKYYFIDNNRINLSSYEKWDLIITISSYDDWFYEDYFTIYEMWKISCNNNHLEITNREWIVKEFWKKIWTCWQAPDYILNEEDLLNEINKKYDLCNNQDLISFNKNEVDIISENINSETITNITSENISEINNFDLDKENILEENKLNYYLLLSIIIIVLSIFIIINKFNIKK